MDISNVTEEVIERTPLSVAVVAGRTSWNSFHKGGNYIVQTDRITNADFKFLLRLKKDKHLSVFEHINYKIKLDRENVSQIELLLDFTKFIIVDNLTFDTITISLNLRTILEEDLKDKFLIQYIKKLLPKEHQLLISGDTEEIEEYFKNYDEKTDLNIAEVPKVNNQTNIEIVYNTEDYYTFKIENVSRALLHELVRHKMFSAFTVKSTRYTLKELRDEKSFNIEKNMKEEEIKEVFKRSSKYLILTDDIEVNIMSIKALENLRYLISEKGIPNDLAKYALPESYKTTIIWTIHKKGLVAFKKLRCAKGVLWEINELCERIKIKVNNIDEL